MHVAYKTETSSSLYFIRIVYFPCNMFDTISNLPINWFLNVQIEITSFNTSQKSIAHVKKDVSLVKI